MGFLFLLHFCDFFFHPLETLQRNCTDCRTQEWLSVPNLPSPGSPGRYYYINTMHPQHAQMLGLLLRWFVGFNRAMLQTIIKALSPPRSLVKSQRFILFWKSCRAIGLFWTLLCSIADVCGGCNCCQGRGGLDSDDVRNNADTIPTRCCLMSYVWLLMYLCVYGICIMFVYVFV